MLLVSIIWNSSLIFRRLNITRIVTYVVKSQSGPQNPKNRCQAIYHDPKMTLTCQS